jgi:hypothetical protein
MSSRLRKGLLASMTIIVLILTSVMTYAGSVTYTYDGLNRLKLNLWGRTFKIQFGGKEK